VNYLLDTNAAIALLNNAPRSVRSRLRRAAARGASVGISAVSLFELWYGVARSQRQRENALRLQVFLSGAVQVLPFEEDDAKVAGDVRAYLEKRGTPIGPYDLLIAAQALRSHLTLVTANTAEFKRVPGLRWQDWATRR
jgi:tRNA(fMet)-specific endonuclease VapC